MEETSQEKKISELIEQCKKDAIGRGNPLERRSIEIMGKREILDVFRLPINSLFYNIRNGRFAAELKDREAVEGRKMDPMDPIDAKVIRDILLHQNPEETAILLKDLKDKGQIEPGLITPDGQIINGNRRKAIFELLFREISSPKYEFLEVQVLPSQVDKKSLWRIEAGLQLSRDKRLDYSPINQLLKIEEGITSGLTSREIAQSLYGKISEKQIEKDLHRLTLIKEYLEYIEQPEQYVLIKGLDNHFINLQNQCEKLRIKGFEEHEISDLVILGYENILGGMKHMDIRRFADIFLLERASTIVKSVLNEADERGLDGFLKGLIEIESLDSEDEIDEPLAEGSMRQLARKARARTIRAATEDAIDVVLLEKDREMPIRLLNRAKNALDSIDMSSEHLKSPEVKDALRKLVVRVNGIIQYIRELESGDRI